MSRSEPWFFAFIVVLCHSSFKGISREWTQFVPSGTPSPPIAFYFKGYPGSPTPSHYDPPKSLPVHRYDEKDETYGGVTPTVRPIVEHSRVTLQKQRLGGITQKFASAKTKINPKKFAISSQIHRYSVEKTNSTAQIKGKFSEMKSQVDHSGFLPPKINKSLAVHQFKNLVKHNFRKPFPSHTISSNAIDLTVDLPTRLQKNWKEKNIHSNETLKRPIETNRKIPIDPKERNITASRGFGSVEGSISEGSTDQILSDQTKDEPKNDQKASDSEFFQNNNLFADSIPSKDTTSSNREKNRPSDSHLSKTNADEPVVSPAPPPPPSPSIPAPALPRFDQ